MSETNRFGQVYRAPMRSRSDEVDPASAVEWALATGVVGVGLQGRPREEERIQARLQRFADVADGSFVWTRDGDGLLFLGQIVGPLIYDPAGEPHDLVNVRSCLWCREPVDPAVVPAAVRKSFQRGGRNFQRINDAGTFAVTSSLWEELRAGRLGQGRR